MTVKTLLVGMHFQPPAKAILAALRPETPLLITPDRENQYDDHALWVKVSPINFPAFSEEFDSALAAMGHNHSELANQVDPITLGHVAATGGKPLAKAQLWDNALIGNLEVELLARGEWPREATLAFGPNGEPLALIHEGDWGGAR